MRKIPFRLTAYQVQWLLVVGFVTVGYALYLRYLAVEFSPLALACDAGLPTMLCKSRAVATALFKNSVFGIVALVIASAYIAVNEGSDNWQSLWTCAIYVLFAVTLWQARAAQIPK